MTVFRPVSPARTYSLDSCRCQSVAVTRPKYRALGTHLHQRAEAVLAKGVIKEKTPSNGRKCTEAWGTRRQPGSIMEWCSLTLVRRCVN